MKAILLCKENRDKIIEQDCGVAVKTLDVNIEKDEGLVFVVLEDGWMFVLLNWFEMYFKPVDMELMKTEFVDVEMK